METISYMVIPALSKSAFFNGRVVGGVTLNQMERMRLCDRIIESTCIVCGITPDEIARKSRDRKLVEARYIVWNACKEKMPYITQKELGLLFNKDHSTVVYALKQLPILMEQDEGLAELYRRVIQSL